jgi:serine/threonine-protein kinase RsbW
MSGPARGADSLRLCIAASVLPCRLGEIRSRLAEWARAVGLAAYTVDDVVLATHEALANVADHAYPDGQGDAVLQAECRDGVVRIAVRDHGRWRPPADDPGWRGRGLLIIKGLAEHVDLQRGDAGTSIEMRWHLPRTRLSLEYGHSAVSPTEGW